MKRLIILFSMLLVAGAVSGLYAQVPNSMIFSPPVDSYRFDQVKENVQKVFQWMYPPDSVDEDGAGHHYQRWLNFWEQRVCNNLPDSLAPLTGEMAAMLLDKELHAGNSNCLGDDGTFRGNWQCMGPFRDSYGKGSQKNGRVQALWVDPSDTNHILLGAASGGLWKTTDGGQNWTNITDQSDTTFTGTLGIDGIAVDPLNHDRIYLTTGTQYLNSSYWNGIYGLGPVFSTDGGQSWQRDMAFRQIAGTLQFQGVGDDNKWVRKMAYEPNTEKLYAISGNRIFLKSSPTGSWQNITPGFVSSWDNHYRFTDFQFTYNPAGKIVFSTNCIGNTQYLIVLNETTQTWQTIPIVIPNFHNNGDPGFNGWGIEALGISPANEAYMGLFLCEVSNNYVGKNMIYKIDLNSASNLTAVNTSFNNDYKNLNQIIVSPVNPDIIYITQSDGLSSDVVWKSTDGGNTIRNICITHADGRCLLLYKATNSTDGINDILYAGTDGGISKKSAGDTLFHSIMGAGICLTQFYGLSTDPTDNAYMTAGAQDNGSQSYNGKAANPWEQPIVSGDGMRSAFANNGVHLSYTQTKSLDNYMDTVRFTEGQDHLSHIPVPSDVYPSPSFLRRVKFNQNNLARAGYHYIWQQHIGDTKWVATFGLYPNTLEPKPWPLGADILSEKTSIDFIFPETDSTMAYLAYFGVTYQPVNLSNDTLGKLYYGTDINNSTQILWTNITPTLAQYYTITDIETDPAHPNRVWAAFGNVNWGELEVPSSQRQNRVLYSDDYGATWQDKSKGLTALPIHKVLYIPGSDDVLFAATDMGVYRWNKDKQQWECFNNGMPKQIVTDLDYNPCSGKLRAATYGRGIWESDIVADPLNYTPGETDVIPASYYVTWNTSKTISGSVRVKSGATLNISGANTTIYMPKNARILVEPNAKLIIDGATITNQCDSCEWEGIELMGNNQQPPLPQYQGSVVLKNNATLENASIAIRNFTWDNGAQGGGIINARNSTILNCWRSVELNDYGNYSYNYQGNDYCYFDSMTFMINDPAMYQDIPHSPSDFFTSFSTDNGVIITNSHFISDLSIYLPMGIPRNRGIYVAATGMKINNCTFDGFSAAVECLGFEHLPTRSVQIFTNHFNNNKQSIVLGGTAYGSIKGNTISNMSPGYLFWNNSVDLAGNGIYLDGVSGAYVSCNNLIDGTTTSPLGPYADMYGIIANNEGNNTANISDNMIKNTFAGMQSQQQNTDLHIFCNNYTGNTYAWLINPESPNYLFTDQGNGCGLYNDLAGNTFVSNQHDIKSFLSTGWNYYAGNGSNETPVNNSGAVNVVQCSHSADCSYAFACTYNWTSGDLQQAIQQYTTLKSSGLKYSPKAETLYGDVIRGFNDLDSLSGLQDFLESEADDRSRKLLVPLYINKGLYSRATATMDSLSLSEAERTGYNDYYNLLINLHQNNRKFDSLTDAELQMVEGLAADTLEVSLYAKAYLAWWYQEDWKHSIEALPLSRPAPGVNEQNEPNRLSKLGDAVPNPTRGTTAIDIYISDRDAGKQPTFAIVSTMGEVKYRQQLKAGKNHIEVNTNGWYPGVYVYHLSLNSRVIASKKLSVTR